MYSKSVLKCQDRIGNYFYSSKLSSIKALIHSRMTDTSRYCQNENWEQSALWALPKFQNLSAESQVSSNFQDIALELHVTKLNPGAEYHKTCITVGKSEWLSYRLFDVWRCAKKCCRILLPANPPLATKSERRTLSSPLLCFHEPRSGLYYNKMRISLVL